MDDPRAKEHIQRWRKTREAYGPYFNHCEDLARVMLPSRVGFITQVYDGDRRSEDIYDGTAMQAARGLANAVDGMLWPDGQKSFFIETVDDDIKDDPMVRAWCEDAEEKLERAFDNPQARFRQARGEANTDLVVFGGAHIFIGEGKKLSNLIFQTLHPKDATVFYDEEGNPEGMAREKKYTLRQAIARFTVEALSGPLQEKAKAAGAELDKSHAFLHVVVPRKEAIPGAILRKNLPFADLWYEIETSHTVEEGGFHEFPFAGPRWDTSSGELTPRSPGMIALPDANTSQAMEETLLIAGQRAASPPLLVPNDGAFDAANTYPDGLSYYDAQLAKEMGQIPIKPLETGAKMPIVMEMQDKKRDQIWAAFLKNVLNLPTQGPQMTAEEIRARMTEMMREIGPVFGRFETDYKAPTVERPFKMLLRIPGVFLPVPPILQFRNIKFRYSSPVKKLKQLIEASATRAWLLDLANLAKMTGDPSVMDVANVDEASRFEAEAGTLPHQVIRSRDDVAKIRADRDQKMQQQQQATLAQQAADAANKGAGAIKQLQPETQAA